MCYLEKREELEKLNQMQGMMYGNEKFAEEKYGFVFYAMFDAPALCG